MDEECEVGADVCVAEVIGGGLESLTDVEVFLGPSRWCGACYHDIVFRSDTQPRCAGPDS